MKILERIEKYTFYSPDGCWYWTSHTNEFGYGCVFFNGKKRLAHRVNYELLRRHIPVGLMACHTCDNPSCINPDHIFLGTMNDNMKDMIKKGRSPNNRGDRNPSRKLNSKQVMAIRSLKPRMTLNEIAKKFDVTKGHVWNIVHRKTWNHI